jgi:hypothetical protein
MTGSCPVSAHVCQETVRERDELRRWKAEALPVLSGLQELGKALGLPLGSRITGTEALAAVERLTRERDEARAEVERLRAGIEALTYVLGPGLPRGRRTDRRVWDATRSASEMAHDLLNPTEGETDE